MGIVTVLILAAQLSSVNPYSDPKFKEWFEKAKVGEWFTYTVPSGCNTCSGRLTKISDTEVHDQGIYGCTLVNCSMGETIKVK